MSGMGAANVRSIQTLEDLRAALQTFAGRAEETVRAATIEGQRTLEFLAERERYWRGQVTNAQAEAQRTQAAFTTCRSHVVRDSEGRVYQPPCDAEAAALRRAQEVLKRAQEQQVRARALYAQVEQAVAAFHLQTQRMNGALANLPNATSLLTRKVETLHGYTALAAPAGAVAVGGAVAAASSGAGGSGGFSPGYMHAMLSGLARGGAASPDTFAQMVLRGGDVSVATPPGGGAGPNLPLRYVPLSQIDVSDSHVRSADDFNRPQRASLDDMRSWYDKLERVVAPGLAQGATGDDFQNLDNALGLDYHSGYQNVFETFYGTDAIALNPTANGYRVLNGFHRLYAAQQSGMPGVPAYIVP